MSGFDRIKPPEKRLLERGDSRRPDADEADPQGRAALFSASGAVAAAPAASTVAGGTAILSVECGHCGEVCAVGLKDAARKALPLALLAPWRRHPVFAVCPCGQRRAWLRPRLGLPGP